MESDTGCRADHENLASGSFDTDANSYLSEHSATEQNLPWLMFTLIIQMPEFKDGV